MLRGASSPGKEGAADDVEVAATDATLAWPRDESMAVITRMTSTINERSEERRSEVKSPLWAA